MTLYYSPYGRHDKDNAPLRERSVGREAVEAASAVPDDEARKTGLVQRKPMRRCPTYIMDGDYDGE